MGMRTIAKGVLGLIALSFVGCAQSNQTQESKPSFSMLEERIEQHLAECSTAAGFDPRSAPNLSETSLVAGEAEWLNCAYSGVESIMIPNTDFPNLYRQLIAESKSLSSLMDKGEVTRTQRRNRMDALIAEIESKEIERMVQGQAEMTEERKKQETEQVRQMIDNARLVR